METASLIIGAPSFNFHTEIHIDVSVAESRLDMEIQSWDRV
jgi:hypothetical protein